MSVVLGFYFRADSRAAFQQSLEYFVYETQPNAEGEGGRGKSGKPWQPRNDINTCSGPTITAQVESVPQWLNFK